MNVVFVYPDLLELVPDWRGAYFQGLASLSAVLKEAGHCTSLAHITTPYKDPEEISEAIRQRRPDLIAFSSTTNGFQRVRQLAAHFSRALPGVPTLYGGVHATLAPEESIAVAGIDMICVGEGEGCIVDVCTALEQGVDPGTIKNLWIKNGKVITRNTNRPLIADLDTLPDPDRDLFDYPVMYNEQQGMAVFLASRGCPFSCTYCANEALRTCYRKLGTYVRFRSPENVIAEIRRVCDRYDFVKGVHFDDDILFMKRPWAQRFTELYRQEIHLPFRCNMHPSLCTEDTVDLLAACGCKELRIGLESGNDYIRMQLLNRNLSRETIVSAFENAKVRGMNAFSFNMVGLPHENAHRVLDTIKLNAECETDDAQVSIFYPYPGTRLYDLCGDEGLLSGRRLDSYYLGSVLNLPDLTHDQVMMFQLFFNKLMKLYRPLLKLPRWLSRPLIWALDGFVSLRAVASIVMSSRKVLHASRRARGKPALRHKYTATVEAS